MNILADRHHADLTWSLVLLANRLGATIYFPIGMDWYDQGYYKLYGNLNAKDPTRWIAKQYLEDTYYHHDPTNRFAVTRESYEGCIDYPHLNVLTLEQARTTDIDIVICSVHENEEYFGRLKEFYPNAKFIRQVGNDLDTIINEELYPNLLSSAMQPFLTFGGHKVVYKQEFDLDLFRYKIPDRFWNMYCFQGDLERFEDMHAFWIDLKHRLPSWEFKSYGVGNEHGKIYPKREYIAKMNQATFIPQSKGPWEGYGHVLFNAFCLGRPMILRHSEYADKIAAPMLIRDETFLEMDDPNLVDKIKYFSKPDEFKKMSLQCRQAFTEYVDFDKDFVEIKKFFEELV